MKRLYGNITGLKPNQIRRLENLYRRRIPPEFVVTPELSRDLARLSRELGRQIGLLINRSGKITHVLVGDHHKIVIPHTNEYRAAPARLKGIRCVHTHPGREPLTHDDLTDLALLRLDMMTAVTVTEDGLPEKIHIAHLLPDVSEKAAYRILEPLRPAQLDIDCLERIQALENELAQIPALHEAVPGRERVLLVGVSTGPRREAMDSLNELEQLAISSGMDVIGTVLQQRRKADSKYLLGFGKLQDLAIHALQKAVTMIVFDQELNPSQIRSITDVIDLKVIDRTQLILDIFAQRAQTREGKLQVELAQLKYLLPRLITKNTAMSRLTGGIGGRGPGETRLEINRRRVRERIGRLEKALEQVKSRRKQQKSLRSKREVPVISIIGYTNAGKSTLLNTLTHSRVPAENRLFATLDPTSRRLKFPRDIEVIITDTVGFIKNLPKELMVAFRATLEELNNADLLLHVIDIANPLHEDQIESVETILWDLELTHIPQIRVLNKQDRVDRSTLQERIRRLNGIPVSANDECTLTELIEKIQSMIHSPEVSN